MAPTHKSSAKEKTMAVHKKTMKSKSKAPPPSTAPAAAKQKSTAGAPAKASKSSPRFLTVGIGASAGGLEAFEQFFRKVSPVSGMAYVLVPHLDPSHHSMLVEILQRVTVLPVFEALDQMTVAPDTVYVIPPNRDMGILHGALQLSEPVVPRGQRLPIDSFFRSLAADQGENAIGVVLSGTGSDGTLGLRAILGVGGITMVQEPGNARYDGMPNSAINSGFATYVMPAPDLPAMLLSIAQHSAMRRTKPAVMAASAISGMNQILLQLRDVTGHDFSMYKKSTIGRRIERRMAQQNIEDYASYARYLKEFPSETKLLFKELLINVTNFFRDPEAFAALKDEILPGLLANKPEAYVFRVWVAGCASGEEAYSIAIILRELIDETVAAPDQPDVTPDVTNGTPNDALPASDVNYTRPNIKVQIYATDLDHEAIDTARAAIYPSTIEQDVSAERLRRFFLKTGDGYTIKKDIREMVVFAVQNVVKDPPFTKLDLLSCRNLMIYLEPQLQERLIPGFHYALKPNGVLFLSTSESIVNHPDLFSVLNRQWKFYRAAHTNSSARPPTTVGLVWAADQKKRVFEIPTPRAKPSNLAELTNRVLLQTHAPASVVVDARGDILYVHGDTGRYLRPAPGHASLNIIDMARDGLQGGLRFALANVGTNNAATQDALMSVNTNGAYSMVSMSLRVLPSPNIHERLLLVSFKDAPAEAEDSTSTTDAAIAAGQPVGEQRRVKELEQELAYSRESMQAIIEEQHSSSEELKSTSEEMQTSNEELQSTNEELQTSREELQSLNEELLTVNAELQSKIQQLDGMQNGMRNLLDNVNIGTIFLDHNLKIRRFTRDAVTVYRLVESDIGRALSDIKANFVGDDPVAKSQKVLRTLTHTEFEVRTTSGATYQVRIQPYRTVENTIEGVVITFSDISTRVLADDARQMEREAAEAIVDAVRDPLLVLDGEFKVITASGSFCQSFDVRRQDTVGQPFFTLDKGQWNIPSLRERLEACRIDGLAFDQFVVEHESASLGRRRFTLSGHRVLGGPGAVNHGQMLLLTLEMI